VLELNPLKVKEPINKKKEKKAIKQWVQNQSLIIPSSSVFTFNTLNGKLIEKTKAKIIFETKKW
jgi:Fe-S cluster biosynthesis and repair protein YggX